MYQSGQELSRVKKNVIATTKLVLLVVRACWRNSTRVYSPQSRIIYTDDLFLVRPRTSWKWVSNIDWQICSGLYCPLIENLKETSRGYIIAGIDIIWSHRNKDV